jgi:hypothetical protein
MTASQRELNRGDEGMMTERPIFTGDVAPCVMLLPSGTSHKDHRGVKNHLAAVVRVNEESQCGD